MAEAYRRYACTFRQALEQLKRVAADGTARLAKVRLELQESPLAQVVLWIPDQAGPPRPSATSLDLGSGLAAMLIAMSQPGADAAAAAADEWLFVGRDVPDVSIVATLRRFEIHATPARLARFSSPSGPHPWLLHVLAQRARGSGLSGLLSRGELDGWTRLACHRQHDLCVFLPDTAMPPAALFKAFTQLLVNDAVRSAIVSTRQGVNEEHFFIVAPVHDAAGSRYERLTLPEHSFVNGSEVALPICADVGTVELRDRERPPDLLGLLAQDAPTKGYRLALRPMRRPASDDVELRRLRQLLADVEQRVTYLQSINRPRPLLLRFFSTQLRALAHVLYSYPVDAISGPRALVRYAFEATARHPDGIHFLLIAPEAVKHLPDPLPLYPAESPVRFWLDPSWSRYYHDDQRTNALVFVPDRTALFPSLHTWSVRDMDQHLRFLFVDRQGPSDDRASPQPQRIYLFDQPEGVDALEVLVLDDAAFSPVGESLHWLSDNLTLATFVEQRASVARAAAAIQWEVTATDVAQHAPAALRRFAATNRLTSAAFAKDLEALIREIEEGTTTALSEGERATRAIETLIERIRGYADFDLRAGADITAFSGLLTRVGGTATTLSDDLAKVQTNVETTLRKVEQQRDQESRRLEVFVRSLDDRRAKLLELLERMR